MHTLFNYYKNTLFAICCISLLTGCGSPWLATEKPFNDPLVTITPGQTTRENVHGLLGKPLCCTNFLWPSRDKGNVEVFLATGDALGWAGFIPFPSTDRIQHYAMIAYDLSGLVNEIDSDHVATNAVHPVDVKQIPSGREAYSDSVDPIILYAGEYGYYNRSNTFFPSKDGGGKADKAWVDYMISMLLEIKYQYGSWDKERALKLLCRAVEQGHPAAYSELGHLFRENRWLKGLQQAFGYYALSPIKKDNVKACFWYAMANDKVQPPWCRDLLTMEESTEVEYLLENWQPGQCEHDLLLALASGNPDSTDSATNNTAAFGTPF